MRLAFHCYLSGPTLLERTNLEEFKLAEDEMRKVAAVLSLILGTAAVAMAGAPPPPACFPAFPVGVPEIDAASGVAALALVAGAVLIIRARRRS